MADPEAATGDTNGGGVAAKPFAASLWSALTVLVVMGAIVALVAIVLHRFPMATDAASILGIVVPAVVTVGAAALGIAVAYDAGSKKAEAEKGQAEAETAKDAAERERDQTSATSAKVAAETTRQIEQLDTVLSPLIDNLQESLPSPSGSSVFRLEPGEALKGDTPLVVQADDLVHAKANLEAARSNLNSLM